jgi:hypothetical protein
VSDAEPTLAERLPLSRRAGDSSQPDLVEGIPDWLYPRLAEWLWHVLQLTNDAVMTLRPGHGLTAATRDVMLHVRTTTQPWLLSADDPRFLDAIDAALARCDWEAVGWGVDDNPASLEQILSHGNSIWRVNIAGQYLERRIDETVTAAITTAIANAGQQASEHLAEAWTSTYGRRPDPDRAYAEAVKAVEALAGPLVSPLNNKPTLGTVIRDLGNQTGQWELSLADKDGHPAPPGRLIEMLRLLWEGQSRHAGGTNSRRHAQSEAEAAVHLAAALVQWLNIGVLRSKP